jgi:hypothetical protein
MECSNCHKQNPTGSRFCQHCGRELVFESIPPKPAAAQQSPSAIAQSPPKQPASQMPRVEASGQSQLGQLGKGGTTAGSIWGPFAGYGTRGRHESWLLDELGHRADDLHSAVSERFQQRQVPDARMHWQTLVAKGILVERRPFYFVRRGIITVALYIAQFGKDLYISQVTYAKGPITAVRSIIVGLMLTFALYFTFIYSNVLAERMGGFLNGFSLFGGGDSFPTFLLCVIGPLGLLNQFLVMILFIYSLYKWLSDRDFLAILRARPNEFQEDDTVALEKAVEETVRQSLDKIGVDSTLMLPVRETSLNLRRLI